MKWQSQSNQVIQKNHTPLLGRIPSVKGYRFYVNELLNDENISVDEIEYIKDDGVWVCTFLTLPETIINEDGTVTFGYSFSHMHVVLRENGELVWMGY